MRKLQAGDPAVAEEACLGIVNVVTAKKQSSLSKEASRAALQTVAEKSKNDATRAKATEALKTI